MSGSDPSGDTWISLIRTFRVQLGLESDSSKPPVTSETDHRSAVTHLCDQYRYRDVHRLLNRICRQHGRIIQFCAAIDHTIPLQAPFSLESLIWPLFTGAVQAAFEAQLRLPDFVKEIESLNNLTPSFNRERLRLFGPDQKVQKPLQEFFSIYMNCYLSMFSDFATFPSRVFQDYTKANGYLLTPRHAEWEAALEIAEHERQQALMSATVSSLPNGSLEEPFRNQGTNAQFVYEGQLGKGTFGEVSKVKERTSGTFFAQKLIRIRSRHDTAATQRLEQQVINEFRTMQRLRHDHIASVSVYVRYSTSFSIIMLPVADYDLRHFLEIHCAESDSQKEDLRSLDTWFGCLISALAFAHEKDIKHADIKPSNILIKDNRPYLADFGSAKDFSDTQISASPEYQVGGTPVYWPPENSASRGRPADIFALGCVFSEMLTVRQKRSLSEYREARYVPDLDFGFAFRENLNGIANWLANLPEMEREESIPHLLLQTILKMLKQFPDDRPTARWIRREFRKEEYFLFCQTCS